MPLPPPHAFGALDWSVLALYALTLLGIGYHFSRKQSTTEEYFVGGRKMKPFLAGISIFTATSSIIAYVGTPGEYIQYGPVLVFFANLALIPFVQIVVGWLIIPMIMRIPITSAYELLQARLGLSVRRTGSLIFIVSRFVWMAMILYAGATVLVTVIGWDAHRGWVIMLVTGVITTTYTLIGGIRTVMITEVVQFFMLLAGALLTLASVTYYLGGIGGWWPHGWEAHWPAQPVFTTDPHVRVSIVGTFVYYLFAYICIAGSDQASIQRLLTTRDARAARRAYLLSNVANGVVSSILGLVGMALLGFYRRHPEVIPGHLTFAENGDAFFPHYISHYLPAGISGLLVACMLAAAMSCLAAGLNATVTVINKDFLDRGAGAPPRSQAATLRITRLLILVLGAAVIAGSIGVGALRGNLFEISGKTINLLLCPIFGLFFLAMFVKFATPFGAILGALYSATAAAMVAFWDVFTGGAPVSFLLIIPVSFTVSLGASCLFSLLPLRGRGWARQCGWGAACLVPLALAVVWLVR